MDIFATIGNLLSSIFSFPIRVIGILGNLYTPVMSVVSVLPSLLVVAISGVIVFFGIRILIDLL